MSLVFAPLDDALGSKSKVRLLRALTARFAESARSLARAAGVSHMPALRALEELVAAGLVTREIVGRQHSFSLNRENELVLKAILPAFEFEAERVHEIFQAIGEAVAPIRKQLRGVYLFGSAARGEDVPGSDFDILAVTRESSLNERVDQQLQELFQPLQSRYGLNPSVVALSSAQLRELQRQKHPLARELARDVRVVTGPDLDEVMA